MRGPRERHSSASLGEGLVLFLVLGGHFELEVRSCDSEPGRAVVEFGRAVVEIGRAVVEIGRAGMQGGRARDLM